jgi:hypothetical protein
VATGRDSAALAMACGEVLTLADGIIVRNLAAPMSPAGPCGCRRPGRAVQAPLPGWPWPRLE